MRDQQSIPLIAQLHPEVRKYFQDFIEECESIFNVTIRIVQGLRTFAEQDALYAIGRTKPGTIVTRSPAGSSYHNYGLAVDIAPLSADGKNIDWNYDFSRWANIASQWSITWGGNFPGKFKDPDHFEEKCGHNWRELLDLYNSKKFIADTQFVDI